jgi:hypothetical protein
LSLATYQSCKNQNVALELHRTYDFLTRLHDEFEPLCAQLLPRHPCVSLMDAIAEVHNEETRLHDAGLLRVSSVLAARSLVARPAAPMPPASPPGASSTAHGASTGLHCDHCGRDGHVDAFAIRRKLTRLRLAVLHRVLVVLVLEDLRGALLVQTQELLMLLHRLATFTSSGVVGSVTQPSELIGSATASQSSTLGPPFASSPGTHL